MEVVPNMLVLITYDINTGTAFGQKRLRSVAKACEDYGHRVQNSVFECELDMSLFLKVKDRLVRLIDQNEDSIRFYQLGDFRKVDHFGVKPSIDFLDSLLV